MFDNNVLCLDGEVWKDIPNYEGLYEASTFGRIRTHINKTTYTDRHGDRKWKQRIMKGRGNHKVTGKRVGLWKDGVLKDWLFARLVAITFLGEPVGDKNTVNHINGDRLDNRVENLEWLSLGDNIRHAFDTGLMPHNKIVLYNNSFNMEFQSMSKASVFIGRNNSYISLCLSRKRSIIGKDGTVYKYRIIEHE